MKMQMMLVLLLAVGSSWPAGAQQQGDVQEIDGLLQIWHAEQGGWVGPETYFELELIRLDGPTYGKVSVYPSYKSVAEWETLVDVLDDGSVCPMVFFHSRWRRLPDVLALDERIRNYGGCANVFNK